MFYQVKANLYFIVEDEAKDFYRDCQLALLKSSLINVDTDIEERGIIQLLENVHDTQPLHACTLLEQEEA